MERVPLSQYFAEPLGQAQMRGAQLGMMRQQNEQMQARNMAEMASYGVSDIQGLEEAKIAEKRRMQEQEAKQEQWGAFSDIMEDLQGLSKQSGGQDIIKGALADPDISGIISPFIDPASLRFEGDKGTAFVASGAFPGNIKTPDGQMTQGELVPGKAYRSVGDGETGYFEEMPLTQKMAKAAKGKETSELPWDKAASSLLMKLQGTTTSSGIVIDPQRQAETMMAASLLHKYKGEDINTAVVKALEEARQAMGNPEPVPAIPEAPKDAESYLKGKQ